ncbi:MAG TPA: hypothetical protein VE991_13980 [Acidimicrobiales bacterium]|nr:hypothetical protein [Acidimicrobiales bacterium]
MARLIGKLTRLALLAGVVAAAVAAVRNATARDDDGAGTDERRVPMSFDQWPAVPHAAGNGAG